MVAYSFKHRFIVPISLGLGVPYAIDHLERLDDAPKRQTFRAIGKRRHARPGETLQLYYAMRSPACFLIGEAICTDALPAIIWPDCMTIMISGKIQTARQIRAFVCNDGFVSIEDARAFFKANRPKANHRKADKIEGVVIKWRPL